MYNKEKLVQALILLGKRLDLANAPVIRLLVCGGAALIITDMCDRPTKDIDIVAIGYLSESDELKFKELEQMPEILQKEVKQVALDLGLAENWLNSGPTELMRYGLPEGFQTRTHQMEFGKSLVLYFISRYDQIHFKVYAATDSGPGRHVEDLVTLNPTADEMFAAAQWVMQHDSSKEFRTILKDMLKRLDYESVSNRI